MANLNKIRLGNLLGNIKEFKDRIYGNYGTKSKTFIKVLSKLTNAPYDKVNQINFLENIDLSIIKYMDYDDDAINNFEKIFNSPNDLKFLKNKVLAEWTTHKPVEEDLFTIIYNYLKNGLNEKYSFTFKEKIGTTANWLEYNGKYVGEFHYSVERYGNDIFLYFVEKREKTSESLANPKLNYQNTSGRLVTYSTRKKKELVSNFNEAKKIIDKFLK